MPDTERRTLGGGYFKCVICGKRIWKERSRIEANATGEFTCSREHWKMAHKQFWAKRRTQ